MKTLLTLTLLCFGMMAQAQIPSYVPTNGLVGWWPFNGNANDESGNGNHGTVNGATLAADRFGNAGKAYSFDGVNDYISTNNISFANNGDYSISLWVNLSSAFTRGFPQHYIIANSATTGGVYLNTDVDEVQFGCRSTLETSLINKWYHYVLVKRGNGGGSSIVLYRNDSLFDINSLPCNSNFINGTPIFFGQSSINTEYTHGLIDDIAIYNRALSYYEITQLFTQIPCLRPSITAQPQNKSVAQGQTTTFAVQVDSASSFQWQMDNGFGFVNLVNSSLFSGVSTSSLTVKGSNSIDGYAFRCIATSCKDDTSNSATLTVTSSASAAAGTVAGVPGLINYQGSALDSAGKPLKNQTISLKLSVVDSSSTGAAVYVETHNATTNGSGHFAIQIGGGTAILGTFDSVGWANGRNKYLKSELSHNGTWVNLGTSQLVSVPYALHAGSAQKAMEAKRADEATTLRDSAGNVFSVGYSNGQPTLVAAPGSGSASNPGSFACGQSVTYAGESYPTVQIGNQCWFQKNLNVGTMILGVNDQTNNSVLEKYCYNNDTANCAIYGGLYQWAEAVQYQNGASNTASPNPAFSGNVKGICPSGWHVPSDGEWCTLTSYIDVTVNCNAFGFSGTDAGGKMKSTSGLWASPNTGATNNSGFSALPGGYRPTNGTFYDKGYDPNFWSSFESSNTNAFYRYLLYYDSYLYRNYYDKGFGFSVRCLKD